MRRLVLGLFLWTACTRQAEPAETPTAGTPLFREVASERHLDFTHCAASERRYWFPEIMGGGVALLDFDRDGLLDVYCVQSGDLAASPMDAAGTNRLYRNTGGQFEDVTENAGVGDRGYGMGVAVGDIDADGFQDLYVTNVGPDILYRNRGDGTFEDATIRAGLGDESWGTSAGFFDADSDGDLDLFVANYVQWSTRREVACRTNSGEDDYCSPNAYSSPSPDALYVNDGTGRFRDCSRASGIAAVTGNGLGVCFGDVNGDGRTDIYVANDLTPNRMWINRGVEDGIPRFSEEGLVRGCALSLHGAAQAGMGVTFVDLQHDGAPDLFVTNLRNETNSCYLNEDGWFRDRTTSVGLGGPSLPMTGFGTGFGDFDLDGRLDLYVANGGVTKSRNDLAHPYDQLNQVFLGDGERFEEFLPRGGTNSPLPGNSRGCAIGDLDGDGDLDVVVVENGGPVRLLENQAPPGHWLQLDVFERDDVMAIGAVVELRTDPGQTRTVTTASSYCTGSPARLHFGLTGPEPLELTVRFADGTLQAFGPLEPGRTHALRRRP